MTEPFTLTSALVLLGFLVGGPLLLFFFARRESRRQEKLMNKHPKAKRYSSIVDAKLDHSLDEFETKIS